MKKVFLPSSERELIRYGANKIYHFHKNKYYYLKDNQEDETWELYCVDIKNFESWDNRQSSVYPAPEQSR